MCKPTPNPPEADHTSPQPEPRDAPQPGQLFTVVQDTDNECLLANLSETLASADAMVSNLAFDLEGSHRHIALGVQQLIELSSLLANRVLDNVDPR
jgi:hypothetical protein